MANDYSIRVRSEIERGYNSNEPLCTQISAEQQQGLNCAASIFQEYDINKDTYINEEEFIKNELCQPWCCTNEQEARNLYNAIRGDDDCISAERYGAFMNVRETGDGKPLDGFVSGGVNDKLIKVAQDGPNSLVFDGLTLSQKIDLIQYGKIRTITTEQLESGRFTVVKEDEG